MRLGNGKASCVAPSPAAAQVKRYVQQHVRKAGDSSDFAQTRLYVYRCAGVCMYTISLRLRTSMKRGMDEDQKEEGREDEPGILILLRYYNTAAAVLRVIAYEYSYCLYYVYHTMIR